MNGDLIFLIPIYLRSAEEHARLREARKRSYVQGMASRPHPIDAAEAERLFELRSLIPFDFGLIIGYIEVRHFKGDIKAYYWLLDSKRISEHTRTKRFRYCGKLWDIAQLHEQSNAQVVSAFFEFFGLLPKLSPQLSKWHVDYEAVARVIPYVNFHGLYSTS